MGCKTLKALAYLIKDLGIKVLKYDIVPSNQDLTPYLSAIRVRRPDILAFGGHDEELIRLVKTLRQIKWSPKALIMHYGVTEPAFVEALGASAEQVFGASVWTSTLSTQGDLIWKDAASYAADIKKAYNITPDYTMAACSAAGIAFQSAAINAKVAPPFDDTEKLALIKALEELEINTFYGPIAFANGGEFHHANIGLAPLALQIQSGNAVIVGPEAYMEKEAQYPMK